MVAAFTDATKLLLILLPGVYLMGLESVLVQHFNALGLPRSIPLYWLVTLDTKPRACIRARAAFRRTRRSDRFDRSAMP